jgi:hypothetical protein
MGTGALSPGVKRLGDDADHSPPASGDFKKIWIYTSTPPYALPLLLISPNITVRILAYLFPKQVILGSNLGPETGYHKLDLYVDIFSSSE